MHLYLCLMSYIIHLCHNASVLFCQNISLCSKELLLLYQKQWYMALRRRHYAFMNFSENVVHATFEQIFNQDIG